LGIGTCSNSTRNHSWPVTHLSRDFRLSMVLA
jgi:hypothetical protein